MKSKQWKADRAVRVIEESCINGECWECLTAPSQIYPLIKGYGKASRLIWEMTNGPIPVGIFVCHSCDNTRCIRPDHLFLGTPQDNMDDKVRKGRQHFGGSGCRIPLKEYTNIVALRYQGLTYDDIGRRYFSSRKTVTRFLVECPHD